jgi:Fur family transcriptional regulator, ferric uptake regulator
LQTLMTTTTTDTTAQPLLTALERSGHRLTEPRAQLAELITGRMGHFTAAELLADAHARHRRLGRATVFRTLDLLVDLGALERIDLPSGEHAYVSCAPAHHHHVVCSRCGRTAEVADLGLGAVAQEVGRRTGYQIESHRLELYGLCPLCRQGDAE